MNAYSIKVRGVVQGVGFRPFVFRLARAKMLAGWVLNGDEGVEILLEGSEPSLRGFIHELKTAPPAAARIAEIEIRANEPSGFTDFTIRESHRRERPTTLISPDLPVCQDCLRELFDPADGRFLYPYINCTNCGPRYTVTQQLPYDRQNTTMAAWPLDEFCSKEYDDPENRRFHAQPVACPACGPAYHLRRDSETIYGNEPSVRKAAALLAAGEIVAVKGLGGYHLACDARNSATIYALRERKYRKEKPFALMVCDLTTARQIVELSPQAEDLLTSIARPIVIAPGRIEFPGVAPGSHELGVMLAYTPLHRMLFHFGAPAVLVMTSANRSNEPIAFEDAAALEQLSGIADAFLMGERPIARRVDDSVARAGAFGPMVLRRSRGYAPGAVASIPAESPILALGADLKNTVALVVAGQAFVSQHIGDLSDYECFRAYRQTIDDLICMYEASWDDLVVVHDLHPEYASTKLAQTLVSSGRVQIQHHRAHVASVLAERGAWGQRVLGVSFDGTGYGDDGAIWGGEIFAGSVEGGFDRVAHLRQVQLPGGDAAAQYPVQAAAGFLAQIDDLPDFDAAPFFFPVRYHHAQMLLSKDLRSFATTSMGRLFDAAASLLGFTRPVSFEGQAAIWLEQLAREAKGSNSYPFPFDGREFDFRPLLHGVASDRLRGRELTEIARAFQRGIARGVATAVVELASAQQVGAVVFSGGVFQNELLIEDLHDMLSSTRLTIWTNHEVPANDGGLSLGQAALAAFQ